MQHTSLFGLAPDGVYPATDVVRRGALLPHHFTLTALDFSPRGGIFSVALSVDSRPPGVTWHPALWSPDFPLTTRRFRRGFSDRPTRSLISLTTVGTRINLARFFKRQSDCVEQIARISGGLADGLNGVFLG